MKVQELINAYLKEIKKDDCEYPYSVWTAGEILEYLDNTIKQVASDLDFDEHRWYIISTNVYKCEDGFIGVRGVRLESNNTATTKYIIAYSFRTF